MQKQEAKKRIEQFVGAHDKLTFDVREYENDEWVAECNEIPAISTCGQGYDIEYMFDLFEDAILTAAGIPEEHCEGLLKRLWNNKIEEKVKEKDVKEAGVFYKLQDRELNHA